MTKDSCESIIRVLLEVSVKKVLGPLLLLSLFISLFSLSDCSSADKNNDKKLITLSGAFAIYPTAVLWAEEFHKLHHEVKVEVSAGGAGKGAADCIAGLVDIGMVSRDPDPSELENGILAIEICQDGVFVIANEKNPMMKDLLVKGVTRSELLKLYKERNKVSWEELAGIKSGAKTPVNIYTRSDSCGAAATFAKFLAGLKQEDLTGIGVNSDPQMINAVLSDLNGISYTNFSYIFTTDGGVIEGAKVIPIDTNENGEIDAEEILLSRPDASSAIEKGVYPISRTNYFYHKGKPEGIAREFIEFCLGGEGTKILNDVGTSLPLPDEKKISVPDRIR